MKPGRNESPYVGLVPYSEDDAARFCGREVETEALVSLTLSSRCLVVHGPSGVGKSSLLRAGVSATLHRIAGAQQEAFGKPDFVVAYCSDWKSAEPLREVQAAISTAWGEETSGNHSSLRETVAAGVREKSTDLVLILDQFEEFFLYHPAAVSKPEQAAQGWLRELAVLLMPAPAAEKSERAKLLPVHLVIALREEALAKLDSLQRLFPQLFDNVYRVAPLTTAQARGAVIDPLEWWNLHHPTESVSATAPFAGQVAEEVRHGHVEFEELSKVRHAGAADGGTMDAVEAPFLQLVLETVWHESRKRWAADPLLKRELDTPILLELGGAPAIVNNHLKRTLEESTDHSGNRLFPPGELELIARLSLHLVTADLAKIAHSAGSLADFVGQPAGEVGSVLSKLERLRIVRRAPIPGAIGQDRFEIAHDMLGKAIINWRPSYLKKVELARQRESARVAQLRRSLKAAIATLCVVVVLAGAAWNQKSKAERATALAFDSQKKAEISAALASESKEKAELEKTEATQQRRKAEEIARERTEAAAQLEKQIPELVALIKKDSPVIPVAATMAYQKKLDEIDSTIQTLRTPLVARLEGHKDAVNTVAFSAAGDYLATAGADGKVIVRDTAGRPIREFSGSSSEGGVLSMAFAGDPKYMLTGSSGQSLRLFDWHGEQVREFQNAAVHRDGISTVTFSPDFKWLATSSSDKTACLISPQESWFGPGMATATVLKRWPHNGIVSNIRFSLYGAATVTSCDDGRIRIFGTAPPYDLLAMADCEAPTRHFTFSPVDTSVVAGAAAYHVVIWNWRANPKTPEIFTRALNEEGHIGGVTGVVFSDDGKYVASIACDGDCYLWEVSTRKLIARVPNGNHGRLYGVDWKNGNLALLGEDGILEIWSTAEPASPSRVFSTQAHYGTGRRVKFSPDGNLLLTCAGAVNNMLMSPKGKAEQYVPSKKDSPPDNTAALWDVKTILAASPRPKR